MSKPSKHAVISVTSADGTLIAAETIGEGSPLIMLGGAFNTRQATEQLAVALQSDFETLNPDRRGRGDSGDTLPYSVEREIEDVEALLAAAGRSAAIFGYSSGGTLALMAAARGLPISKLVLYDTPFLVDDGGVPPLPADLPEQLAALVDADRRGAAVELFQKRVIGIPDEIVVQMRHAPFRPGLEAIAHTLVYESMVIGDLRIPPDLLQNVVVPTLVIVGEESAPVLRSAGQVVAEGLPRGRLSILSGQGHDIAPEVTADVMRRFLTEEESEEAVR